jgi:PAP2 superfamily
MLRRPPWIAATLIGLVLAGCGTLPSGDRWGDEATYRPGWEVVRESAVNATRDPWVWGPLLGAAAFQIDNWDRRVSDWARENTPVFGSETQADEWSDDLRKASVLAHYATIAATPSGNDAGEWIISKAKGVLVDVAAVTATGAVTQALKSAADRERPNGLADESFPSGHTASSAVHTRLASRNLQSIPMSRTTRSWLDAGLYGLTIGTSWARIEAGWHFPSDTLFSMALGNFIGAFVNDAFMGLDTADLSVGPTPRGDGYMMSWRLAF